jgi:hypothetical protein
MAKTPRITRTIHAAIPINLYRKFVAVAFEMAENGDVSAGDWLVEEIIVMRQNTIRREFELMKRDKEFLSGYRGAACVACGKPSSTIDHIKPIGLGGTNEPENLQPMCFVCNAKRAEHGSQPYKRTGTE